MSQRYPTAALRVLSAQGYHYSSTSLPQLASSLNSAQPLSLQDGEIHPGTGAPVLFTTYGSDYKLRSKALFFLRNAPPGKTVDLDVASGGDLLVGEISPALLSGLANQVADVWGPALDRREDNEWGKADTTATASFKTALHAFNSEMMEALESLDGGIALQRPDGARFDLESAARELARPTRIPADVIRHFEGKFTSCVGSFNCVDTSFTLEVCRIDGNVVQHN